MMMMIWGLRYSYGLRVETGRWRNEFYEERICRECQTGDIEDVCHWLQRYPKFHSLRGGLDEKQRVRLTMSAGTLCPIPAKQW